MEETKAQEASQPNEEQTVVFRIGQEFYGIDIFRVNEIIRLREITPIPRTEGHIRGLVNLRGKTVPVVDLRARMNLPELSDTESTRIIVVESQHGHVGIVVDAVTEVAAIQMDSVDDAPNLMSDVTAEFVRGVAKRENDLVTLLDLDHALAA